MLQGGCLLPAGCLLLGGLLPGGSATGEVRVGVYPSMH